MGEFCHAVLILPNWTISSDIIEPTDYFVMWLVLILLNWTIGSDTKLLGYILLGVVVLILLNWTIGSDFTFEEISQIANGS